MISDTEHLRDSGLSESASPAEPRSHGRWLTRFLLTLLDLAALAALTLGIGRWSDALRGFPKGYDALAHLSKVQLILDNWPHINWNDAWYAGMPNFSGSYPPGYHLLVAAITRVGGIGIPQAMLIVAGLSMVLVAVGSYGFVRLATGSRVLGWLAALALLAQPTFWDQSLAAGLYPRLLALGLGTVALPAAVLYGRRPSRLRGALLVLCLAGSLSVHPVIGVVMAAFAAGVVVILAEERSLQARAKRLVAPTVLLVLLVSYFYLPLLLLPRGQSPFTLFEVPVPWSRLVWPVGQQFPPLASWSPVTLPLILAAVGVFLRTRRRPLARVDPRLAIPSQHPAEELDRFLAEVRRAGEMRQRYRRQFQLAVWCGLFAAGFLIYCLLGHFRATFPYYVNGLQPGDIIVYPAFFAVLGSALALLPLARRLVTSVPLLLVGAIGVALLYHFLPGQALNYNYAARVQMEQMVQTHVPNQHVYRIAAGNDSTTEILGGYTQTPQTGGAQAQAELDIGWQVWLQDAILDQEQNGYARKFLFDWYAVQWILIGNTPTKPYLRDPSYYRLVAQGNLGPSSLWEIRDPTPIFTATDSKPLLFIGDTSHYDLVLRALAAANADSSKLIPVEGGDSLAGYNLGELRSYSEVVLWGSPVGGRGAALLDEYVRGGGRVFVDEGEAKPLFPKNAEPVGQFKASTIQRTWSWRDVARDYLSPASLHRLPRPNYANTNAWQITYPTHVPANATILARSHGYVTLAAVHKGQGTYVWSGLNLPYLASSTHAWAAGHLLVDLMTGTTEPQVAASGGIARRLNAEHWEFTVPAGTTALLVRQNTSRDWRASNATTGAELPIRSAGPGMTLILLPRSQTETKIELQYRLSTPEQAGLWLSALGVLLLLVFTAGFRWPKRWR